MPKLEYWDIPREDKRERCGKCLRLFEFKDTKFRSQELERGLYRFTKVCGKCNIIKLGNNIVYI